MPPVATPNHPPCFARPRGASPPRTTTRREAGEGDMAVANVRGSTLFGAPDRYSRVVFRDQILI